MSHSFGYVNGYDIGIINTSLGTKDRDEAIKIEDAIIALADLDRGDLLYEIKNGKRSPSEVYRLVKSQKATKVKALENGENLKEAVDKWLPNARRANGKLIAADTRLFYKNVFKVMQEKCATKKSIIADLPDILKCYQAICLDSPDPKNRTFNKTRAACFAFARGTQIEGRESDLYRKLARINAAPSARMKERVGLMVWEMREILEKLESRWKGLAWLQVCSGMRSKELANHPTILEDRIIIHGTKTAKAQRVVPKISDFDIPYVSKDYKNYNAALKRASNDRITNYDLRGTYRLWLTEAGIDRHRARRYCGWSTEDKNPVGEVEHGYTSTDIDNFLRVDTELLVKYLEQNWERPKANNTPMAKFTPTF